MQGKTFTADVRVLQIGGCDMVLGVQWLSTLGPIVWDFKNLKMQFNWLAKPFLLKGNTQCKVEQVSQKQMDKSLQQEQQGYLVFEEPKTLPPTKPFDHRIALAQGSAPVQVKPYRSLKPQIPLRPKDFHFNAAEMVDQVVGTETVASPGLLQPLPIPERMWTDISMDFVEGLLVSQGKSVIFVVVDRLSKHVHFMALSHPYTALDVAKVFLDTIFKLHGMPASIVSDRDVIFTCSFWKGLFHLQGTTLNLSTSYHPHTDGQTEVVNRCLETYIRCMTGDKPKSWVQWLPLAERWFNTTYHTSTHLTPYQAIYGRVPPSYIYYIPSSSRIAALDQWCSEREATLRILKEHSHHAQNRMKQQADKHRSERSRAVAHPTLPPISSDRVLEPQPIAVLDRRLVKYKGRLALRFSFNGQVPSLRMLLGRSTMSCYPSFLNSNLGDKAHLKGVDMIRA
ncbi:hypothetical protein RHSIM_Rhsim01G0093500 [Rhododendron simsii]|uniref:Integrase catalytic domain-containing protein n=1 Tax=Rhododendron simsii TaxID=118357 RepID=A0A834HHW8_RHOSS|nr:hypothetical protein RHSIM_Rhsim01G0093500 [Rhododendron simsii]